MDRRSCSTWNKFLVLRGGQVSRLVRGCVWVPRVCAPRAVQGTGRSPGERPLCKGELEGEVEESGPGHG